jgi:hypothetical protein
MSRLPHYLDNRLIDGGKVVSLTRRPPFTPQEDSWYSFLLRDWVIPRARVQLEGLSQLKENHLIGTRTCDLLACSIVPQPTMLPYAPFGPKRDELIGRWRKWHNKNFIICTLEQVLLVLCNKGGCCGWAYRVHRWNKRPAMYCCKNMKGGDHLGTYS